MFSTAEKTSKPGNTLHIKSAVQAFVGKHLTTLPHTPSTNAHRHRNSMLQDTFVSPAFIQPKLTVSTPGDAYEREADATAAAVMRMSETPTTTIDSKEELVQGGRHDDAWDAVSGVIDEADGPVPAANRPLVEALVRKEHYVPNSPACTIREVDPMSGNELPSDISGTHTVQNPISQQNITDYII